MKLGGIQKWVLIELHLKLWLETLSCLMSTRKSMLLESSFLSNFMELYKTPETVLALI